MLILSLMGDSMRDYSYDITDDALTIYVAQPQYDEDACKEVVKIPKSILMECYARWGTNEEVVNQFYKKNISNGDRDAIKSYPVTEEFREFMEKDLKDAKKDNYALSDYDQGHMDGYEVGYQLGYDKGCKDSEEKLARAYAAGAGLDLDSIKDAEYQKGQHEAFDAVTNAIRTLIKWHYYKGSHQLHKVFGSFSLEHIIENFSIEEIIFKIKSYSINEAKDFQVGDEVFTSKSLSGEYLDRGVIISFGYCEDQDALNVMSRSGGIYGLHDRSVWTKTGRHFDEIEKVLEELK